MGRARKAEGGRFNERSEVVLKEEQKGELIAIRSRGDTEKNKWTTGNTFPAIRFPSRFLRPLSFPLSLSLVLLGSTEDPPKIIL